MIHMNLNPVDFNNYKPIFTQKGFKEISLKDEEYSLLAEVIESIKVINEFKEEGTLKVLKAEFEVPGTRIYEDKSKFAAYTCETQDVFLVYGISNIYTLDNIDELLDYTQYIGGSIYLDPSKPSSKIIYMDNISQIVDSIVMNHTHLGVVVNKEYFNDSLNVTKQSRLKIIMTNILSTISDLLYLENKSDSAKFFVDRNSSLFEFSIDIDGLPIEGNDISDPIFAGSLTLFSSQLLYMGSTIEMMSTIFGISEKQALQASISILCDSLNLVNTNIGTVSFNKFVLPITKLMQFHLDELKNESSVAIREMKIARKFHSLFKEFNTPVETKGNVVPLF